MAIPVQGRLPGSVICFNAGVNKEVDVESTSPTFSNIAWAGFGTSTPSAYWQTVTKQ
jgi:hypothetical protein